MAQRSRVPRGGSNEGLTGANGSTGVLRQAGVGQLALLTPALVLGLIGFLVPICWVGSVVLMGILWGSIAVHRQQLNGGRGVLSEVVDVVVDEAKDVADAATRKHPVDE
jgi:hypothetical protein